MTKNRESLVQSVVNRPLGRFWLLPFLITSIGFTCSDGLGQLLFNTVNNSGIISIRQANVNGTGNTAFNIPGLPAATAPTYSNNGQLLSVIGQSTAQVQQNQISNNAFIFDTATNQTRQVSNFIDVFLPSPFDPNVGDRQFTQAVATSFSPDGSMLAVSAGVLFIDETAQSISGRTLTFFRVSDGQQLGLEVVDNFFNGTSSGGAGVSWSPVANVIAYPRSTQSQNPLASGPTPISSFNSAGQLLANLTSPTSGFVNGPFSDQFVEHDYFPTFSPNGVALAYFRSTRIGIGPTDSLLSLRITSPAGDRAVLNFAPGQLPLGVSWSVDGTQLFYSVGAQPFGPSGFTRGFDADPTTSRIGVVNVDGSANVTLLNPPAFFPEFFPGSTGSGNGDFNNDGQVNVADIDVFGGNIGQNANGALAQLDLDGNGTITLADHDLLISQFVQTSAGVGSIVGDINLDGTVDVLGDAFILVGNLNRSGSTSYGQGDLNADNQVNVLGDAFRLVGNLGQSR